MNKTIVKVLTAAAMISGAVVVSQPASAMGFKNCTGHQIRIKIYNNRDTSRLIAKRNRTLGVSEYYSFNLDSKLYQAQIYISRPGADKKAVLRGGLKGTSNFSVRRNGGRYSVSNENGCGSAGVKPGPVKTIAVSAGRWEAGRNRIRIRAVTSRTFELKQKGEKGWTRFTLVGRDTYRNAAGLTLVMRSNGRAVFQGVQYNFVRS
jgi:hypothetical protein